MRLSYAANFRWPLVASSWWPGPMPQPSPYFLAWILGSTVTPQILVAHLHDKSLINYFSSLSSFSSSSSSSIFFLFLLDGTYSLSCLFPSYRVTPIDSFFPHSFELPISQTVHASLRDWWHMTPWGSCASPILTLPLGIVAYICTVTLLFLPTGPTGLHKDLYPTFPPYR